MPNLCRRVKLDISSMLSPENMINFVKQYTGLLLTMRLVGPVRKYPKDSLVNAAPYLIINIDY